MGGLFEGNRRSVRINPWNSNPSGCRRAPRKPSAQQRRWNNSGGQQPCTRCGV